MSPGVIAQIKEDWRQTYRAPGAPVAGVVQAVSPSGDVARIRLDPVADSYILVSHLEPADLGMSLESGLLGSRPAAERVATLVRA